MISDYESITILYGTMMGNAESVAHQVATTLQRTGLSVRVSDMAHCQASLLTRLRSVLIVTSTYGNGDPPDDIIPFWQAVVHGNVLDLRGLRFSVLALGNTTYDTFASAAASLTWLWSAMAPRAFILASIAMWIMKHPPSVGSTAF
jgi:sulfite reductase (NADPH) flavoprotein alpha-component